MQRERNEIECPHRDEGLEEVRVRHGTEMDERGRPRLPGVDRVHGYFTCDEEDGSIVWRLYHPKSGCYLEGDGFDDIERRIPCGKGSILELRVHDDTTVRVVCPGQDPDPLAGSYEFTKTTPWHDW